MKDTDCVTFLQWALPRLHLRWAGFRKVRRQVCRRVQQRIRTLGLSDICAYRNYLEQHAEEWSVLDGMTPITISSFYRDRDVWDFLWHEVLQNLATGEPGLRAWSIGCASGEEPFTLMLTWRFGVLPLRRDVAFSIVATDVHQQMLARAHSACYEPGSLKLLPASWRDQAFRKVKGRYCLRPSYRQHIDIRRQDIRTTLPDETFHLIMCRNLVFTYFDEALQQQTLARMLTRLRDGGVLVIGRRESLPADVPELTAWPAAEGLGIYLKAAKR
jgi:chemotaxis protein methyltransferase CheR